MEEGRKCIFITGAASGIGLATARLFGEKSWFVGAYDVDRDGLERLVEELGADNCKVDVLDVTDRTAFKTALDTFGAATGGRLDLLYNNAGVGTAALFVDQDFDDVMRVVNTNFVAVLSGIHLAYPMLKATENSLCFTTSSSSGIVGIPGLAVYSATKHAVKGMTEALSVEFAGDDVRAADVLPGTIDTPILPDEIKQNASQTSHWRLMPAASVAETVWAAYHDKSRLHWYVPEDLGRLEPIVAADPEAVRDGILGGRLP
ncbi:MAG: SDR family oxidoreductase [Proteobacteria bacterium]|nr:SDR family oxidoreductase [Pseudomonadota bacterium]